MSTIGISLGGSVISKETGFDKSFASDLAHLIADSVPPHRFIITTGGGYLARSWITKDGTARSAYWKDKIGIEATRANALTFRDMLSEHGVKGVSNSLPTNDNQLEQIITSDHVIVFGGLLPGITTDACVVHACEMVDGKLVINISETNYIYDDNPNTNPAANRFEYLTHDELVRLAATMDRRKPGTNFPFDLVACAWARRSEITVKFVKPEISSIAAIIRGEEHDGTTVS